MTNCTFYREKLYDCVKFLLYGIPLLILCACSGNHDDSLQNKLLQERDSLKNAAVKSQQQIKDMNDYFVSISDCIDSIAIQEQILLVSVDPETNRRYSKLEMRHRLMMLSEIIARQRERIKFLTDSLHSKSDSSKYQSLSKMVAYLTIQLDEKENKINQLIAEINSKNRSIAQLSENVEHLKNTVDEISLLNKGLEEAVVEQTRIINEGHVLIGTAKELQDLGILTKGSLFKKSKLNVDNVKLSLCQAVDISRVSQIPLNSKNPKILTSVPKGSYRFENDGSGKILIIENASSFWSLSNILIIQL